MASIPEQIKYLYGQVKCLSAQIEECCNQVFDFIPYTGANKTINLNTQQLLVGDITANKLTIAVPDTNGAFAIYITLGGVTALQNPDGIIIVNEGRSIDGLGELCSFYTVLSNLDNVGYKADLEGNAGVAFNVQTKNISNKTGYAFYLNDETAGGLFYVTETGNATANSFIKLGGLATQYLMADGSVSTGGGGGLPTNLAYVESPTQGTITSSTGTSATIPLAGQTKAGLISNQAQTIYGQKVLATGTLDFNDTDLFGDIMKIYANANKWQFSNTLDEKLLDFDNSLISFFKTNLIKADISNILLTSSRTYSLPDNSGTFALLSDLTPYALDANVLHKTGNESASGTKTFSTGIIMSAETASTIASFDANKNIKSLPVASYPNLAELALVKGATGLTLQAQINAKAPLASPTFTGTVVLPSTTSIGSVSNTEISYLNNVTSSIQTQLNGKADAYINGAIYRVPIYTSTSAMQPSRIYENGFNFGIGTVNPSIKDFALGYNANREIGIENSSYIVKGANLSITAGKAMSFAYPEEPGTPIFVNSLTTITFLSMSVAPNGDVWGCNATDVYKQTGGIGTFNAQGLGGTYTEIYAAANGDIWASVYGSWLYKMVGGVGPFVAFTSTNRSWAGITGTPNGDIYASVFNGDIYRSTGGTGTMTALGFGAKQYYGIAGAPNGDVWVAVRSDGLYKKASGSSSLVKTGDAPVISWQTVTISPNGEVFAAPYQAGATTQYIYKLYDDKFILYGSTAGRWSTMASASNGTVYASSEITGTLFTLNNSNAGTANLDGGVLRLIGGSGKGTGTSKIEFYTGEKTVSGTDMQASTIRLVIDDNIIEAKLPLLINIFGNVLQPAVNVFVQEGEAIYATSSGGVAGIFNIDTPANGNIVEFQYGYITRASISAFGVAIVTGVELTTVPNTSASTYDILTRNTFTGEIEKILSSSVLTAVPTLQQVTDSGNSTTNQITTTSQITAGGIHITGNGNGIYLGHTAGTGALANSTTLVGDVNKLKIYSNNGANPHKEISFNLSQITTGNAKSYIMPDANGTIALTDNLVGKYVTEAAQTGIVFFNNDRANYGNIGVDAVDFSYSGTASSVFGATGESSFATGIDNISSGYNSTTFGYLNTNASVGGFVTGTNNQSSGYINTIFGAGHDVTGTNITVVGQAAEIIAENPASNNIGTSPIFVIGNGTITDNDPDYTVLTRSNAFVVRKNGAVEITNTLTVGGSIAFGFINKIANYTLTKDNRTIEVTTASTQTLPTAVGISGREYRVINASTENVIVDTTSSQTIGNKNTETRTSITLLPEEWLDVISNGSNWRII